MEKWQKVTVIVAAAFIVLMLTAVFVIKGINAKRYNAGGSAPTPQPSPAFSVPGMDNNAVKGEPDNITGDSFFQFKLENGAKLLIKTNFTVTDGKADVGFALFGSEDTLARLFIYEDEKCTRVIGETGTIKSGYHIQSVKLDKPPAKSIWGYVKIQTHDSRTYYSQGTIAQIVPIIVDSKPIEGAGNTAPAAQE